MRKIYHVLLVLLLIIPAIALADQEAYCDPIPDGLKGILDGTPQDCIVFEAPDGTTHAYFICEGGWRREGYRLIDGQWHQVLSTAYMLNDDRNAYFTRHQAGQLRPDGTAYSDDQGYDLSGSDGASESYHWDGEYYSLCGWSDPMRYDGRVMITGTSVSYFPGESTTPEYETDTHDALLLYGWVSDYNLHPATPEDAMKRTAILPESIQEEYEDYQVVEYHSYDSGMSAEAVLAKLVPGGGHGGYTFMSAKALYNISRSEPETSVMADLPLSDLAENETAQSFWDHAQELLYDPGILDRSRIPVEGTILDFHLQQNQLILLKDNEAGQRTVVVAEQETSEIYNVYETRPLPPYTTLDTFHAGQDEIEFYFNNQEWGAEFHRTASGWKLAWVMGEKEDSLIYTVTWWGVNVSETWERLIGSMDQYDLLVTDFDSIPRTLDELKQGINQEGWAVVCSPDPADRPHLRPETGNMEVSLGEFYNGTPVRVLETEDEWCHVRIGRENGRESAGGPEGWMVKKYLVFGQRMNEVEPAFPFLEVKDEYREQTAWTNADMTDHMWQALGDREWHIIGVLGDQYILLSDEGDHAYVPRDWLFEGNG